MELYSRAISPFAARVRISILAKGLPVRLVESPALGSDAFGALNPYRRVPVLVLDDGTALPESEVIAEYLEDRFPQRSLRPQQLEQRARNRLIARAAELYLFPAVVEIFTARARGVEPEQFAALFGALEQNLDHLAALLDDNSASWHVCGDTLTLADAALAPFFVYIDTLGAASGRSLLAGRPRLEQFWEGARRDPIVSVVVQEIVRGLAEAMRR